MKTSRSLFSIPVVLIGTSICLSTHAAPPSVDAGSLLRQNEQDLKRPQPTPRLQTAPLAPVAAASADEATLEVRAFKFAGNTLLSNEALAQAVAPYVGRTLSVTQLKEAAQAITNLYRAAGWTVRTYLPKQEVAGGVVTLQVVEAVFGGALMAGTQPQRIEATRLIQAAEASLVKGTPLHAAQLDRTLLLLDDLPGVNVTGHLVQGQQDGETNLALTATDEALVSGNAFVDNQGARTTGTERLSVNLNLNSPARMGDALGLNALKTQGVEYQRLSYSVPVGDDGWRAGLHASSLRYQVITPEFATLNPYGQATTRGLDLSYPLLRSQLQNINFVSSYDDKSFDNTSNSALTRYGIKVFNASLNANQVDSWGGGGVTNASLTMTRGDKNTESRFSKLNLSLSRLQSLSDTLSVYLAASTQTTHGNLDSSEKMYLGGATGVRAYPASEAGGSEGSTLTLELRQRIDNTLTLTGFYDYGRIWVNRDNTIASPANPNDYSLQGYGFTVAWQATQAVDLKATVAQRMGSNPAASATGMDGDGTQKVTRFWLSAGISF